MSASLLAGCTGSADWSSPTTVAGVVVEGIQNTNECKVPGNSEALVAQVLELVNLERTSRGLNALTLNPVLSQIADNYCCEMIGFDFFAHVNPFTGEGPGQRAINGGYLFLAMGENLAGGQDNPVQVVNDWMNSQLHRENILAAQWQEVGVAVRTGGDFGVYWVLEFGNPP